MIILNLTPEETTENMIKDGVIDPKNLIAKNSIKNDLNHENYDGLITKDKIEKAAKSLYLTFENEQYLSRIRGNPIEGVMLGAGADFFMGTLERTFKDHGVRVFYPVYKEEKLETELPNGEIGTISAGEVAYIGLVEV